ncbi:MAG: hypothetical protein ABI233_13255 [Chthoniobacterales bacterium]
MYAPPKYDKFLKSSNYTVNFKTYNWGLNDQGPHGRNYSTPQFLLDKILQAVPESGIRSRPSRISDLTSKGASGISVAALF